MRQHHHQDDVLQEAARFGGRVLVTKEGDGEGAAAFESSAGEGWPARTLRQAWAPVAGPEAVQTPMQVFEVRERTFYESFIFS
jgi:hypothetical protein